MANIFWHLLSNLLFDDVDIHKQLIIKCSLVFQILLLASSNIKDIPSLRTLLNLTVINLNSNQIRVIKSQAFIGCNKLTKLLLSSCEIERIADGAFSTLSRLKVQTKQQ